MLPWIIAYAVGAGLFLLLLGYGEREDGAVPSLTSVILWTLLWPIPFLMALGSVLWSYRK
jgi:hypothetical protein